MGSRGLPGGPERQPRSASCVGRVHQALDSAFSAAMERPGRRVWSLQGALQGSMAREARVRRPQASPEGHKQGEGASRGEGAGPAGRAHLTAGWSDHRVPELGHFEAVHGGRDRLGAASRTRGVDSQVQAENPRLPRPAAPPAEHRPRTHPDETSDQ